MRFCFRHALTFFALLGSALGSFAEQRLVRVSDGRVVGQTQEGLADAFVAERPADMLTALTNDARVVEQRQVFADALAIPLHDAGVKTVFPWTGDADELWAARALGVKYVRTDRPEVAQALLESFRSREMRPVRADEFRVRDPFVLADPVTHRYYLYETTPPYFGPAYGRGVSVRTSDDLKTWSPAKRVMRVNVAWQARTVWAPEVHLYRGRYWMFATLTQYPSAETKIAAIYSDKKHWAPEQHRAGHRGVWAYVADSPEGPFVPVADQPLTPPDWLCLDGTLVVDEGRPYLVFCHEWVQTKVGRMDVAPLADDLTRLTEAPKVLFDALAGPGANCVTDGPFVHRSRSGKLFLIWSKFVPNNGYSVIQTESASGRVTGPWTDQRVIYGKNGGHAMVLRTFEGALKLVLHGPERRGWEHLRVLDLEDTGDGLVVRDENLTKEGENQ